MKVRDCLTRLIEESLSMRLHAGQTVAFWKVRRPLPTYAGRGGLHATIHNTLSQRAFLDATDEMDDRR